MALEGERSGGQSVQASPAWGLSEDGVRGIFIMKYDIFILQFPSNRMPISQLYFEDVSFCYKEAGHSADGRTSWPEAD